MLASYPFAPDTPPWMITTTLFVAIGVIGALLLVAAVLERRFTGPYCLRKADNRQKWQQAIKLALLQTALLPVLGLAQPILSPYPDQWPSFPLIFAAGWMLFWPIVAVFKRWDFENQLGRYYSMNRMRKEDPQLYQRIYFSPIFNFFKTFMSAEHRRFFDEGYPDL